MQYCITIPHYKHYINLLSFLGVYPAGKAVHSPCVPVPSSEYLPPSQLMCPPSGVATKDIHTVNTPLGGGIFCVGQYSKLLTKNTPPPNIRNINIIIIPRMKGGIITLNKNEFLVYNFFCLDSHVISLMYNYLCLFVRHD